MNGRSVNRGLVRAPALVSGQVFGFWGGVDTATGVIVDKRHELYGQNIKDMVFVFPEGRGSTVGASVFLELVRCGNAPAAIINRKTEAILAGGVILADIFYNKQIPLVDSLDEDPVRAIQTGDIVEVDGDSGTVRIIGRRTLQRNL